MSMPSSRLLLDLHYQGYYSSYFIVLKQDRNKWPIMDLRDFNQCIKKTNLTRACSLCSLYCFCLHLDGFHQSKICLFPPNHMAATPPLSQVYIGYHHLSGLSVWPLSCLTGTYRLYGCGGSSSEEAGHSCISLHQ